MVPETWAGGGREIKGKISESQQQFCFLFFFFSYVCVYVPVLANMCVRVQVNMCKGTLVELRGRRIPLSSTLPETESLFFVLGTPDQLTPSFQRFSCLLLPLHSMRTRTARKAYCALLCMGSGDVN